MALVKTFISGTGCCSLKHCPAVLAVGDIPGLSLTDVTKGNTVSHTLPLPMTQPLNSVMISGP